MKILFISTSDVQKKNNGGELCTNRNYLSFCELLGSNNVSVINLMEHIPSGLMNALKKRLNFLRGFYEGLYKEKSKELIKLAKQHDFVFINSSTHGKFAEQLIKGGYKGPIYTFFHNVELNIKKERAKKQPWKLGEIFVIKHNEKMACKYSHKLIALNQRDIIELKRIYKVSNIKLIPISLKDRFNGKTDELTDTPATFLFTGNNWYANVHGILWFIDNVLDHVNIKLQITGHRMDVLKDKFNHPKIEFLGFVNDLDEVLYNADFILLPIFLGSGMKVKTCEALMFGKNIIGTAESFQGYQLDYEKVGALCNTKTEFIQAINRFSERKINKFNIESRNYFLQAYSYKATLKYFKNLINTQ